MAGLTHYQHCIPLLTTCLNFPDSFTSVPSLAHAEHRLYHEASETSGWEEKAQVKPGNQVLWAALLRGRPPCGSLETAA